MERQPIPHKFIYIAWGALFAITLCLGVYFHSSAENRVVYSQTHDLRPGTRLVFSDPIELKSRQNLQVDVFAPLDNSWDWVGGDFINEESGVVNEFELPVEYYSGRDGGEDWTEGGKNNWIYITSLPAGRYTLRLEFQWEHFTSPLPITVTVTQGVFAIGALVGLEIPLLMRILKDNLDFKELVSRVLTFDYIGALVASLLFPIFFVPRLGLARTSLLFGLLNASVGLWGTWLLKPLIGGRLTGLRTRAALTIALLLTGLLAADRMTRLAEDGLYGDRIVYARSSPHQRIVVTQKRNEFQLFLNGNLQFNSSDEYRYHEALVHPAMMAAGERRHVLALGGGDGLAVREILRHASVKSVTLVDIDPAITHMARDFAPFAELNRHALDDPRVRVINQDAMVWLEQSNDAFDVAILDFPDPNNFSLGKLYTTQFYRMLRSRLTPDAAVALQCTSPLLARQSYWCILRTMESAGFTVKPYHAPVPSFGVWGFALAKLAPFNAPSRSPAGLRFLDDATMAGMFVLPADLAPVEVQVNRLDNQALVNYYETESRRLQ